MRIVGTKRGEEARGLRNGITSFTMFTSPQIELG
jgi:hypothetical protein